MPCAFAIWICCGREVRVEQQRVSALQNNIVGLLYCIHVSFDIAAGTANLLFWGSRRAILSVKCFRPFCHTSQ